MPRFSRSTPTEVGENLGSSGFWKSGELTGDGTLRPEDAIGELLVSRAKQENPGDSSITPPAKPDWCFETEPSVDD